MSTKRFSHLLLTSCFAAPVMPSCCDLSNRSDVPTTCITCLSAAEARLIRNVINHIENVVSLVQNQCCPAQHDSHDERWQPGEAHLQIVRKWLDPLLQPRRQLPIALKVPLQTRGKVAAALGQSRRQVAIPRSKVVANDTTVMISKHDLNRCRSALFFFGESRVGPGIGLRLRRRTGS